MSRARRLALIPLLGFSLCTRAQDLYVRQPGFDVLQYELAVAVNDSNNYIHGEATIIAKLGPAAPAELRLDLKQMSVASVWIGQHMAPFEHDRHALNIALPASHALGDTLQLRIAYSGEPNDGLIMRDNKFGRRTIFADNWPDRASFWFPGIDHPSDKAKIDFRISVPAHYTVVANGQMLEVQELRQNRKSWHWRESTPIPTYCMVFGAAEFSTGTFAAEAAPAVDYYVYPEEAPHAQENFGRVPEMMRFFTKKIGDFPYQKLALVQSATRFGGMENASVIFFSENSFGKARGLEGTTAHEIAHQWFGDAVTPANWRHLWLSEGFATYGEALFYEHVEGQEKLREKMAACRETYLRFAQQQPRGPILDSTISNYMELLNANNYSKAAWVLHMLRQVVGDEEFWQGLRTYYDRYRHGNATTAGFLAVMEEVSGASLGWFFKQWLEQPGHPHVQTGWQWEPGLGSVAMSLKQTQKQYFFRLPLEIGWQAGEEKGLVRVEMTQREHEIFIKMPRIPDRVTLDPNVTALLTHELILDGQPARREGL
ncbi:MAG: M1 family metallopeptidase [bacterium]